LSECEPLVQRTSSVKVNLFCRKRNGFTKFAPSGDRPYTVIVTSCRPGKACCNGAYVFGCVSVVLGLVKANPNALRRFEENMWRSWMVEYWFAERSRVGQSGIGWLTIPALTSVPVSST